MNEMVDYMIRRYKEDRHIPTSDELMERFPGASWMSVVNVGYAFDSWHTEWTRAHGEERV